jgi:hypothetical protein
MAVRCLCGVPLVKPGKLLGRGEVEPEFVEQPRCLGGPFLGQRGPAPCGIAERRKFCLGIVEFIARKPVEQIPVYSEEAIFVISEARPYGWVQECLDVANGEPPITRTRRSSALLDVIDDRLGIWLWDETRPMGVIPGALLTMVEMGSENEMKRLLSARMLACSSLRICHQKSSVDHSIAIVLCAT